MPEKYPIENQRITRIRSYAYVNVFLFPIFVSLVLNYSTWVGTRKLNTAMEVLAVFIAFTVGALALIRFYGNKDIKFLFLGMGFVGVGFLEFYHMLISSIVFDLFPPFSPLSLIPWSHFASQLFLSLMLFLSWWAWRKEHKAHGKWALKIKKVYLLSALFLIFTFIFFTFFSLPRLYYPDLFIGLLQELLPATLFFLALFGYLTKGLWQKEGFEHWIILSILFAFMGQVVFSPFSFTLFDMPFNLAALSKKISYLLALVAVMVSIKDLFKEFNQRFILKLTPTNV